MCNRVRHGLQRAARVGRVYSFIRYLHDAIVYAYSFITPPCFYSPGREYHFSLEDEKEAIIVSLYHKQQKMIVYHQERRFKFYLISFLLLIFAFKHHTDAMANTANTNLGVTSTVVPKCKVNSSGMAFGSYDPMSNTKLNVNGFISLNCTKNTTVTVSLNNGNNTSHATSGTTRAMYNVFSNGGASAYLGYELYKDSGRTSVWSTSNPLTLTSTSAGVTNIPIYGSIPQRQNVQDGGFNDTVVITINF